VVSRRSLLVTAAGGVLLPGCGKASTNEDRGGDEQRDRDAERLGDVELLQGLLALERQSAGLYAQQSGRLFRRLEAHEREHAARLEDALRRRGAKAGEHRWTGEGDGLALARKIEETAIAAYLDALPKVVDAELRGVLASIVTVEASHLAEVRRAQGLQPANESFVTGRRSL
jgi:Ferritin-like domain